MGLFETRIEDVWDEQLDPALYLPPGPRSLSGIGVRLRHEHGELQLLRGERRRVEIGTVRNARDFEHPVLGAVQAGGSAGLDPAAEPASALDFEVELAGVDDARRAEVESVLAWCLDPAIAGGVVESLGIPWQTGPTYGSVPLPEVLAATGIRAYDFKLASFRTDLTSCVRHLRLLFSERWLITLWSPPEGEWDMDLPRLFPLPAWRVRDSRPGRELPTPAGTSGLDRAAAVLSDICPHHSYAEGLLASVIESWEADFYEVAGGGEEIFDEMGPEVAQRPLAKMGRFLLQLRDAEDLLAMRSSYVTGLPEAASREIGAHVRESRDLIDRRRAELREAFSLLSTAIEARVLQVAESQAEVERRFQSVATIVASFVLVPSLIIGLYSARVSGLPGLERTTGLLWVLVFASFGALVTLMVILRAMPSTMRPRVSARLRSRARNG